MSNHEDEETQHLITLDELEATQDQITSYQGLLKELPEIFEHKFNQRLSPLLDRNQQQIEERVHLLHQLHQTLPLAGDRSTLLLQPASPRAKEESDPISRVVNWRLLSLLGLAALGIAFGVQLSRALPPAPQKSVRPSPLPPPGLEHPALPGTKGETSAAGRMDQG